MNAACSCSPPLSAGRGRPEHLNLGLKLFAERLERLLGRLELGLQALLHALVAGFLLGDGILELVELRIPPCLGHGRVLLKDRQVLGRAQILVVNRAARPERLGVLLEIIVRPAAFVGRALGVRRGKRLDGGISLDAILFAQRFARRGTIHVTDHHRLRVDILVRETVPIGSVASNSGVVSNRMSRAVPVWVSRMGADEFVSHTQREAVETYFMDLQCPHQGARNLTKAFLPLSITSASLRAP
jgi:hypothetical protein